MDRILRIAEWLARNPWLTLAGFFVTVVSFALAIFFYLRSRRFKLPCYALRSVNLVQDMVGRIDGLDMAYGGKRIANLTATKLAIWNAGRETISASDVANADPLMLVIVGEYSILDAKLVYTACSANQFSVEPAQDRKSVLLGFDYFDRNEGAVVQILHTGKSNSDVELHGTIKGVGKMRKVNVPRLRHALPRALSTLFPNLSYNQLRIIIATTMFLTPMVLVALLIFSEKADVKASDLVLIISGTLLFAFIPYWVLAFHILKRSLPGGFEVFEQDI